MNTYLERLARPRKLSPDTHNRLLYAAITNHLISHEVEFGPDAYYLRLPDSDNPRLVIRDYMTIFHKNPDYAQTDSRSRRIALMAGQSLFDIEPAEAEPVMLFKPYTITPDSMVGEMIARGGVDMSQEVPIMTELSGRLVEAPKQHPAALMAVRYLIEAESIQHDA
jgi:hypothetical protein